MNHIKIYWTYLVTTIKAIIAFVLLKTIDRQLLKKDLWLIQEKRTEARDNGYHLFKYIRDNHTDIQVYYAIKKGSPDYDKVNIYGNVINADSLLHYKYYLAAKYSINSQPYGAAPYPSGWTYKLRKLCRKDQQTVFLRHGIQKDEVSHDILDYKKTHFSLVCAAAERERKYVVSKYGFPTENVKLLGFCRFDNLWGNGTSKKQILIMPTFRNFLISGNREKDSNRSEDKIFKESEFYKNYYSLLTDQKLISLAKNKGYKIIFYLHYSLQSFTHVFSECDNYIVRIADRQKFDVQALLIDSSVLVTDFSSVFFDFAYMEKPEVFFQFDEEEYRKGHYKQGYFDYRRDAFGPVITDKDELVSYLIKLIESDCKIEPQYLDRINSFFTLRDNHNCERTYEAIKNL